MKKILKESSAFLLLCKSLKIFTKLCVCFGCQISQALEIRMHFFTNLNLNTEIFISLEWSSLYIFLEGSKNTEKRSVVDAAAVFVAVRGDLIL